MQVQRFESEQEWREARRGKITGTRLKDIVVKRGTGEKLGFYELIAERLGLPPEDGENAMERGHVLQPEAIARFEQATGKKVNTELVMWSRDDNGSIAISPDGWIGKTEAVEVKALSSARHIQAVVENAVPSDYHYQMLQYFAVCDSLKKLYFVFLDPRLKVKDFHVIEIARADVQAEVDEMLEYQKEKLRKVDEIVATLTRF